MRGLEVVPLVRLLASLETVYRSTKLPVLAVSARNRADAASIPPLPRAPDLLPLSASLMASSSRLSTASSYAGVYNMCAGRLCGTE